MLASQLLPVSTSHRCIGLHGALPPPRSWLAWGCSDREQACAACHHAIHQQRVVVFPCPYSLACLPSRLPVPECALAVAVMPSGS